MRKGGPWAAIHEGGGGMRRQPAAAGVVVQRPAPASCCMGFLRRRQPPTCMSSLPTAVLPVNPILRTCSRWREGWVGCRCVCVCGGGGVQRPRPGKPPAAGVGLPAAHTLAAGPPQHSTAQLGTAQQSTAQRGTAQRGSQPTDSLLTSASPMALASPVRMLSTPRGIPARSASPASAKAASCVGRGGGVVRRGVAEGGWGEQRMLVVGKEADGGRGEGRNGDSRQRRLGRQAGRRKGGGGWCTRERRVFRRL